MVEAKNHHFALVFSLWDIEAQVKSCIVFLYLPRAHRLIVYIALIIYTQARTPQAKALK